MKRALFVTATVMFLAGCASYRPIPDAAEQKPFRTYVVDEARADGKGTIELAHTMRALSKYYDVVLQSLARRAGSSWDTSDVATAGGGAAVVGGLAHKLGLMNTGLFVAGTALAGTTRYKEDQQVDISLATADRLGCVSGRAAMLTPQFQQLVKSAHDAGAYDALMSAPEDIIRNVETIQHAHVTSLYALKATVPSRADLVDYFGRYAATSAGADDAGKAAKAASDTPEQQAAIKVMRTFAVELEACAKLTS
jgi:hypothetical protein